LRAVFVGWAIAALLALSAPAIELKPDTSAAFDAYVRATEARMDDDLRQDHFLAVDDLPDARRQETYAQLRRGQIYIQERHTLEDGQSIHVSGGLIHHWVGVVFVPDATLSQTVAVLQDYDNHEKIYKPDVRRSRLLEHDGDKSKIYLQFYHKSLVTVVLNANFDVVYTEFSGTRSMIASRSTRIAEVANSGQPDEHELPVGQGHGYMWRLDTYWRVEEKDGGVYVQNETIALTRRVPAVLAWLINPLVRSIPRAVLTNLLNATRRTLANTTAPAAARSPQFDRGPAPLEPPGRLFSIGCGLPVPNGAYVPQKNPCGYRTDVPELLQFSRELGRRSRPGQKLCESAVAAL
jgi:hypothetical protein